MLEEVGGVSGVSSSRPLDVSHPGWDPEKGWQGVGEAIVVPFPGSRGPWNIYDRCVHSRFFIKCEWIA